MKLKNLILIVVCYLASFPNIIAATFTVNTEPDGIDVNLGDCICNAGADLCTLRAAIQEANQCPGDDRIELPAGTYNISVGSSSEDNAAEGDFDITENLTVEGQGVATTIISGQNRDRVFDIIGSTTTAKLVNIKVTAGATSEPNLGGGIRNQGILYLDHVDVTDSTDSVGIYNNGFLFTSNSTIASNAKGIYSTGGMRLQHTDIINNSGLGITGLHIEQERNWSTVLSNVNINDNHATTVFDEAMGRYIDTSAGLYIIGGGLYVDHTKLKSNKSDGWYSEKRPLHVESIHAISVNDMRFQFSEIEPVGEGINFNVYLAGTNQFEFFATFINKAGKDLLYVSKHSSGVLENVTLTHPDPVGIWEEGLAVEGSMALRNVTLNNIGITGLGENADFYHSILVNTSCHTPISSLGFNISHYNNPDITAGLCILSSIGDLENIANPVILPELSTQSGPTAVYLPDANGPAIDGGDNVQCSDWDQQGLRRVKTSEDPCDIGAVETTGVAVNGGNFEFELSAIEHTSLESTKIVANVVRTAGNDGPVTVRHTLLGGTGEFGTDYLYFPRELVFNQGEMLKSFTFTILPNGNKIIDHTYLFALANPRGGSVGENDVLTVRINIDNSAAVDEVFFIKPTYDLIEKDGVISIPVQRSQGFTQPASVMFNLIPAIENGAIEGVDYELLNSNQTLNFSGGNEQSIELKIIADNVTENIESFDISLNNPTDTATKTGSDTTRIYIADTTDSAKDEVFFTHSNYHLSEENNEVIKLSIKRTPGFSQPASVSFSVANSGTAIEGTDFRILNTARTLEFDGNDEVFIEIEALTDSDNEAPEFIEIALLNPQGTSIKQAANSTTVTINDTQQTPTKPIEGSDQSSDGGGGGSPNLVLLVLIALLLWRLRIQKIKFSFM